MYERMESSGNSAAIGCYRCSKRCGGFLTDREQRKVWGVGVLYLLGFPILSCMILVGALKVDINIFHHVKTDIQILHVAMMMFRT